MSTEQIIIQFSYLAIFALITINGVVSFPSSQLIYILAGYFASQGDLNILIVIFVGAIGNTLGNFILYEIARKKGLDYTLGLFKFLKLIEPKKQIKKIELAFKKRGYTFLFIGKLINPIKIFIPIPAAIVNMNKKIFLIIIFITSTIWATIFSNLGFFFGKNIENFSYIGLIMLALFGVAILSFNKYINSQEIMKEI